MIEYRNKIKQNGKCSVEYNLKSNSFFSQYSSFLVGQLYLQLAIFTQEIMGQV